MENQPLEPVIRLFARCADRLGVVGLWGEDKRGEMARIAGGRRAVLALVLASAVGVVLGATGDVMEESRFVQGVEGWKITVEGKGAADGQPEHDRGMKRVKGGDKGDVVWYFTAPEKVGFACHDALAFSESR